jgi:hypothetical protein
MGVGERTHVCPFRSIVAAPVAGPFAAAGEGRAPDDEGALAREDFEETLVGGVDDLVAPDVVDIVLLHAVRVCGIGTYSVHCEIALHIVDDIWWVVDVAFARSGHCTQVGSRSRTCTSFGA